MNPSKTITEFSGFAIREAQKKSKEIRDALGTEGKSAEELSAAHHEATNAFITERFKLDGERLNYFLKAIELAEAKPRELENLKRIVVLASGEGQDYRPEYLAPLKGKGEPDRRKSGGKHDTQKKSRGRKKPNLRGKRPDGGPERRGPNAAKPAVAQKQ